MKNYQKIEFECKCNDLKLFMQELKKTCPSLYDVWGELIEYNFTNGISWDITPECGYILYTKQAKYSYYVCFIATERFQFLHGVEKQL